jgi:hypothetical protein
MGRIERAFAPKKGLHDSARGFNPELCRQTGATADIRKASLVARMDTGWKPMLHCSLERRAMPPRHAGTISPQTRRDALRRKVV